MTPPTPSRRPRARAYPAAVPAADGAALTFETVGTFPGGGAPLRVRPREWTLLRVVDGVVRLTVGSVERLLRPGEEAIVDPGRPHRIAAAAGEARYVVGFRSAPLR
jgi:mannose-6-phosphate isomerase-like protein (cupin superfamily)